MKKDKNGRKIEKNDEKMILSKVIPRKVPPVS